MSEIEYRSMTEAEVPQFTQLMKYAFAAEAGEGEISPSTLRPEWSLCAFDGDRMVASSGAFPFKMRLNGASFACAGVTGVGADPGYRRRGLVRDLMTQMLHREHEKGVAAAILWASMGAIYQRFGYGLASNHVLYDFDPRLANLREPVRTPGTVRRMEREEALPILNSLYRRYSAERNLLLHRAPLLWDAMIPEDVKRRPHIAVYFGQTGEPTAYVLYRTRLTGTPDGTGPWQQLTVFDYVWGDIEGYRALWEYLRNHDLVHRIVWIAVPEDDPAPLLLLEPRMLGRRTQDGIWMRVIDAEPAFAARPYALSGEVSIAVARDELCPWNNRKLAIASDGGSVEVRSLKKGEADLSVTPNGLASLLCGHSSASLLVRSGAATAAHPERLAFLDVFFATRYRPTCANEF